MKQRVFLTSGLAIMSLGLLMTGCNKMDNIGNGVSDEKAVENAEAAMGVAIDPNQTWSMTRQVSASVSVSLGLNQSYKVGVYESNPLFDEDAVLYGSGQVSEGGTASFNMTVPVGSQELAVVISDSENRCQVKTGTITNQTLKVDFNNNEVTRGTAARRAIQPSFTFPGDADASMFLADVPADVKTYDEVSPYGYASGVSYIENRSTEVNIWGGWDGSKTSGGTLYIKGNCDFSNVKFYVAPNTEVYLLEGAALTLSSDNAANLQSGCNFYMASGSKITTPGELKLNNGLHIYNHGTIEANKLSTNSNSLLYNVGTVKVTTKISVENELSVMVNDGSITAADLNTAGSGKFQNNASVTISGTTFVNSNNNAWVNNGQYHTGNFIYNAASDDVINNCFLTVDEDFNINLGDNSGNGNFKMDSGSGVLTKNFNGGGNWSKNYSTGWSSFNGGPFYIYMGAGSLFKVTGTATMNATKASYGIYGPESGKYAVFQAKEIVAGAANQGYEVTYGGNLAVVTDDHFANGYSGTYPYIDIKDNATIYDKGSMPLATMAIEAGTCNPGFNPGSGQVIPTNYPIYSYAFEDTRLGDYDMNDIVIKAQETASGKINLSVVASGATLNLNIRLYPAGSPVVNNEVANYSGQYTTLSYNGETEVHAMFGVPEGTMVNTNAGATAAPITIQIDKGSYDPAHLPLAIYSEAQGEIRLAGAGQAPFGVVIPVDWKWPAERVNITSAYNKIQSDNEGDQSFGKYAAEVGNALNWYKYPTGRVMNESSLGLK